MPRKGNARLRSEAPRVTVNVTMETDLHRLYQDIKAARTSGDAGRARRARRRIVQLKGRAL